MAQNARRNVPSSSDNDAFPPGQPQSTQEDHLRPPVLRQSSDTEPSPFKTAGASHDGSDMLRALKETPAALKGLGGQAWVEFQDARKRVESAFRRAQPTSRPPEVKTPSAREIGLVLEPDNGTEAYPTIESQMNGETSGPASVRPSPSWRSSADSIKTTRQSQRSTGSETIVRARSMPTFDNKQRQTHGASQNASKEHCSADAPTQILSVPHQIRLRRPSAPKTHLRTVEGIFVGPRVANSSVVRSKAAPVEAAITRTAVHNFVAEERQDAGQQTSKRKLSATLQVVRSRESIYEVIWEDSLTVRPVKDVKAASEAVNNLNTLLDNQKIDTKLAAWSWGFDPTHIYVYEGAHHNSSPQSTKNVSAVGPNAKALPALPKPSTNLAQVSSSSDDDVSEAPVDNGVVQRRRSSAPVGTLESFADTSEHIAREPPTNSKGISVNKRRELLGSRKASDALWEEGHFKEHRDSLMLAHERIFHQDGFGMAVRSNTSRLSKTVKAAPEPRIESLKRSTWTKSLPIAAPTTLKGSNESPPQEGTRLINKFATKVRTPDKQSLAEPSYDIHWLDLNAEEMGPSEVFSDAPETANLSQSKSTPGGPFLELTPGLHASMVPPISRQETLSQRSESATASTAASRAKQAGNERSVHPMSRTSSLQKRRPSSVKRSV